jgi:hypothetical protein
MKHWLKTGQLPDGRTAHALIEKDGQYFACLDERIVDRKDQNLPVPGPDETSPDGFAVLWESLLP